MAQLYARKKGFARYFATSSLFGTNVKNVFDEAIQQTINLRMEKIKRNENTSNSSSQRKKSADEKSEQKGKKCLIF